MRDQQKKPQKVVPDEIVIELSKPIVLKGTDGETRITELELREPSLKQLTTFIKKTGKESALDCMRWLISELSGVPMLALDALGVRDYYKAQDYLAAFLTPPDEDDPEGNAEGSQ
jgi:hypothetical protein